MLRAPPLSLEHDTQGGDSLSLPSKVRDPCNWRNGKAERALAFLWLQFLERLFYI